MRIRLRFAFRYALIVAGSLFLSVISAFANRSSAKDAGGIDFNRDIRPILAENCYACHGFEEQGRKAELRLDIAESAYADRGGYAAIAPGDTTASALWRRVVSDDESERMPPPASKKRLTEAQKEKLRRWIDNGAPYATHWAFIGPRKSPVPIHPNDAWSRNEIDSFVLERLRADNLTPSETANRPTLIRRLSFDLTGLPPSAEEVNAFVADDRSDAYERLVDRLLASAHIGERLALDWLDAARYADTNGFSIDGGRHMWLWRDWVIHAFNENMPYDQFLRDQIAGDLYPDRSEAQLIATGFQRNNMVTHEGGTIPEENLVNYNADRVKTLGEAVLGLTIGCAQCHDHKFDPVTQRDYYRLFAYFNTASDIGLDGNSGVNPRPFLSAKTVLPADDAPRIRERIASLRNKLAKPDPVQQAAWESARLRELETRGAGIGLHSAELVTISTPNRGDGFGIEGGRFAVVTEPSGRIAYDVSMRLPRVEEPVTGLRVVFHPIDGAANGGWGFGKLPGSGANAVPNDKGAFVVTAFGASAGAAPSDQVNLHELRSYSKITASSFDPRYRPEDVLDTRDHNGWAPRVDAIGTVHFTCTFERPIDVSATPYLTAQLNFGHDNNLVAGRFEFLAMTGQDDGTVLPADLIDVLRVSNGDRTDAQAEQVAMYYAAHSNATRPLRVEIANLEERLRVLTEAFPTMVMDIAESPRPTFILSRGDYSKPLEQVTAGTPAFLPPPPNGETADRRQLAEWVTMPENPLTARVAVNRIWKMLFGNGVVRSAADFGAAGEWPTHPELLDWLAVDFVEHGWDVKALIRKIVLSATYRQSSVVDAALLRRDPHNEWLARGPRFRLPAEMIRDSALKTSGLLTPWIGGPSVNPYAPGDLWREVSHYGSSPATAQSFVQDHGSKLYRRSLYTFWKRTVPPPNMVVFDAPNRETCVLQRSITTTPLQALVLLNDVQFVECSRAFAERIVASSADDAARLRWAFEEALSRPPTNEEMSVLRDALQRERAHYAANLDAALLLLSNGESTRNTSISVVEHAAFSQVAALLLNLSEWITRS